MPGLGGGLRIGQFGYEPCRVHCVVFLGQTVYSQSACPHPGVHMDSGEFNVEGNPAMDKHSIQGRGRNTPSWQNANNQDLNSAEE